MSNKIKNSLQNIEASEAAKQRMFRKISDYERSSAQKQAPAFMKWLPLTAAACVLIGVCAFIFPILLGGEYIPPEGGNELFPAPLTTQEIENLTDEEFLDMFLNDKFIIPDIYMPDDFGVPLLENEWISYAVFDDGDTEKITSREQIEQKFTDSDTMKYDTVKYMGENDYYFSFHVVTRFYEEELFINRMLYMKDSAVARNFCENGYPSSAIRMLDKQSVTDILDIMEFRGYFNTPNYKIINREIEETEDMFIYTYYVAWKLTNHNVEPLGVTYVELVKRQIHVDKSTGEFITPEGLYSATVRIIQVSSDTPPAPHNFIVHENTYDFDVNLISLHGDEMHFYAMFEFVPKNGLVLNDEIFFGLIGTESIILTDKHQNDYPRSVRTFRYISDEGIYYAEYFVSYVYPNILNAEFTFIIPNVLMLDAYKTEGLLFEVYKGDWHADEFELYYHPTAEDYAYGSFRATFIADYDPGDTAAFDFTDSPQITLWNRRCILKYILLSDSSITMFMDFFDYDRLDYDYSCTIDARLISGEIIPLSYYSGLENNFTTTYGDYVRRCFGELEYIGYELPPLPYEMTKGFAFVKGFDTSEIVSIIINGEEFELFR
jgi:hypothetical protein